MKQNIVLIGMPSSGKSTIGNTLAHILDMEFVDTDALLLKKANKPLKDVVNEDGLETFRQMQETTILELEAQNHIIATGGSAVYSEKAMNHLRENGIIVYLQEELKTIEDRLEPGRRFARSEGQSISDIYNERVPLYEKYSDIIIECKQKDVNSIAKEIVNRLGISPAK